MPKIATSTFIARQECVARDWFSSQRKRDTTGKFNLLLSGTVKQRLMENCLIGIWMDK